MFRHSGKYLKYLVCMSAALPFAFLIERPCDEEDEVSRAVLKQYLFKARSSQAITLQCVVLFRHSLRLKWQLLVTAGKISSVLTFKQDKPEKASENGIPARRCPQKTRLNAVGHPKSQA